MKLSAHYDFVLFSAILTSEGGSFRKMNIRNIYGEFKLFLYMAQQRIQVFPVANTVKAKAHLDLQFNVLSHQTHASIASTVRMNTIKNSFTT